MCGHWLFAAAVASVALGAKAPVPADPVRVLDLKDNVQVRLVAAKQSAGRGGGLFAKFETLDQARKEIVVSFPSHSFTTHELTLMKIIEGCIGWSTADVVVDGSGWVKVKGGVEAVFSVPKDIGGKFLLSKDYEQCHLRSLKIGDKQ